MQDQRNAWAAGIESTVGESYPSEGKEKMEENYAGINLHEEELMQQEEFHIESGTEATPSVEHQFISNFSSVRSPTGKCETANLENLSPLRHETEEICVSLQLGEPEPKRWKQSLGD